MWWNLSACTKCQIVFQRKIVRQEVSKCRSPLPIPQQGKQAPSSAHCPPPLSPSATRCERRSCQPGRTGCWLDEVSWQLFTILGSKYKCCLSDSQLIKGDFPPKDFGQCWNFEYLGKVGIEKSNKKPKPKPKQHKKLPTSQWQTFFAKEIRANDNKLKISKNNSTCMIFDHWQILQTYMEQQKFVICKQKSGTTEKMQINWCGLVNAVLPFQVYVIVLYNIVSMRCVTLYSYTVSGRTQNKTATIQKF